MVKLQVKQIITTNSFDIIFSNSKINYYSILAIIVSTLYYIYSRPKFRLILSTTKVFEYSSSLLSTTKLWIKHSTELWFNRSAKLWIIRSTKLWTEQSTDLWLNRLPKLWILRSTKLWNNGSTKLRFNWS